MQVFLAVEPPQQPVSHEHVFHSEVPTWHLHLQSPNVCLAAVLRWRVAERAHQFIHPVQCCTLDPGLDSLVEDKVHSKLASKLEPSELPPNQALLDILEAVAC